MIRYIFVLSLFILVIFVAILVFIALLHTFSNPSNSVPELKNQKDFFPYVNSLKYDSKLYVTHEGLCVYAKIKYGSILGQMACKKLKDIKYELEIKKGDSKVTYIKLKNPTNNCISKVKSIFNIKSNQNPKLLKNTVLGDVFYLNTQGKTIVCNSSDILLLENADLNIFGAPSYETYSKNIILLVKSSKGETKIESLGDKYRFSTTDLCNSLEKAKSELNKIKSNPVLGKDFKVDPDIEKLVNSKCSNDMIELDKSIFVNAFYKILHSKAFGLQLPGLLG